MSDQNPSEPPPFSSEPQPSNPGSVPPSFGAGPLPPPPGGSPPPLGGGPLPPPPYAAGPAPASGDISASANTLVQHTRLVVTEHSTGAFDAVLGTASWQLVLIAVGAWAVVRAIFDLFFVSDPFASFIGGLIGTFIGFFIATGIVYLIAKVLGGPGDFLHQSYAFALILAPIGIVDAVIGIIPFLGGLVAFVLGIYGIYLAILGTQSVHRFDMGKAAAAVLIPLVILFVLAIILAIVAASLFLLVSKG